MQSSPNAPGSPSAEAPPVRGLGALHGRLPLLLGLGRTSTAPRLPGRERLQLVEGVLLLGKLRHRPGLDATNSLLGLVAAGRRQYRVRVLILSRDREADVLKRRAGLVLHLGVAAE